MKWIISILFLFASLTLGAETYWVTPRGNDVNAGTDSSSTGAWRWWQKAFDTAEAGDTVWFRGGTYTPAVKADVTGVTVIDPDASHGHDGTHDNPICFFAWEPDYEAGNYPILNCYTASTADNGNIGIVIMNVTNIKLKGLTVRNARMMNTTDNSSGIGTYGNGNLSFENCTSFNNGGPGFECRLYDTLYFINCDSYGNCDSLDVAKPGNDGDGFLASAQGTGTDTLKYTYITGCRAWLNSDDGWDIGSTKQLFIFNNWGFRNGKLAGDGCAFKLAYSAVRNQNNRMFYNNIMAYNQTVILGDGGGGLQTVNLNDATFGPRMNHFNNFSYKDYVGMTSGLGEWNCGEGYYNDVFRNNLVYAVTNAGGLGGQAFFGACDYNFPTYISAATNNTWILGELAACDNNPAYTVTDADFVSLDTAQLRLPRKSDGSLPDITFGRLAATSDLKGQGYDVGFSDVPDIGIDWEYYDLGNPTEPRSKFTLSKTGNATKSKRGKILLH